MIASIHLLLVASDILTSSSTSIVRNLVLIVLTSIDAIVDTNGSSANVNVPLCFDKSLMAIKFNCYLLLSDFIYIINISPYPVCMLYAPLRSACICYCLRLPNAYPHTFQAYPTTQHT